jgi:hypothetical protein
MLTLTLQQLHRDGLITRTAYAEVPPRVECALIKLGESLLVSRVFPVQLGCKEPRDRVCESQGLRRIDADGVNARAASANSANRRCSLSARNAGWSAGSGGAPSLTSPKRRRSRTCGLSSHPLCGAESRRPGGPE